MPRFRSRTLLAVCLAALGTAAAGLEPAHALTVAGASDTVVVASGGTFTVDFVVRDPDASFNAFDLAVHFDPAKLTSYPMSPTSLQRGALMVDACTLNAPFHIFTPGPDSLVGTLVILCSGVSVTGPGTIYRLRFTAAATNAWTQLTLGPGTSFYNGGPRVNGVVKRAVSVKIGSPVLDAGGHPRLPSLPALDPIAPNPARAGRTLSLSFSLPRAESSEVVVMDAQGRRVAGAPWALREAGAQRLEVALPPLAPGRYTITMRTESGVTRSRPWVLLR
ncbi:MAG TPA: cohesin domain-containing protein [Verrucomicrobiae bacterium]|nr:cohesin domain-containing protein [Verrucomicrobiae bacterium]